MVWRQSTSNLCNAVAADIIGVLAEVVVPVGGLPEGERAYFLKGLDHLGGEEGEAAHQLRVKEVPVGNCVLDDSCATA